MDDTDNEDVECMEDEHTLIYNEEGVLRIFSITDHRDVTDDYDDDEDAGAVEQMVKDLSAPQMQEERSDILNS